MTLPIQKLCTDVHSTNTHFRKRSESIASLNRFSYVEIVSVISTAGNNETELTAKSLALSTLSTLQTGLHERLSSDRKRNRDRKFETSGYFLGIV